MRINLLKRAVVKNNIVKNAKSKKEIPSNVKKDVLIDKVNKFQVKSDYFKFKRQLKNVEYMAKESTILENMSLNEFRGNK